jgi:membrane protein DedA with SNARE-associated domain
MDFFVGLITRFGYGGIFGLLMFGIFGLPVPDETLLTFCGYLVSRGDLLYVPTVAAAFLGSCSGVTVSYLLGRKLGLPTVRRFGRYVHVDEASLQRVHRWFERAGRWVLTFGYFVPGFRHLTAIVAGTSCLEYRIFAPFAYAGALFWSAGFVTLGRFIGARWETMSDEMHHVLLIGFGLLSSLTVILAAGRWFLRRRAQRRARGNVDPGRGV